MHASLPLIVGNWKMHGSMGVAVDIVKPLVDSALYHVPACEIVVCPPFPYLAVVAPLTEKTPVHLGAQDCHVAQQGAFTGDVSAWMLRDIGCNYVILGHSERRSLHHESNALVQEKAKAAHLAGLTVIICIGETRAEREAGMAYDVLTTQLKESVPSTATSQNTVIAYEPVWAIGSGLTLSEEDITRAHLHIHKIWEVIQRTHKSVEGPCRVLYGGSVKPVNAASIVHAEGVQGVLVGGASLSFHDFWDIIVAATLQDNVYRR